LLIWQESKLFYNAQFTIHSSPLASVNSEQLIVNSGSYRKMTNCTSDSERFVMPSSENYNNIGNQALNVRAH